MNTEQELLELCKKGKPSAQRTLYEKYKGSLMGICLRYTRSRMEADDIFQEAFIKVFNNIASVREPKLLFAWVKKIVVRTAINHYHKNKKHGEYADFEQVKMENDAYQQIMSSINKDELLSVINELPDGYRMVFNLYVIDGYTHPEIAELLDITTGTSKSQLSRAKEIIKKKLSQIGIARYEQNER